ncbi:MAG: hypothetical protein IIU23_02240 [Bacteroidales bacterium]|nr:hypothetical protein [Bacteroidales bacterium]MBQ5415997.1 hypothetical protein [Bacteroidales bacterium]
MPDSEEQEFTSCFDFLHALLEDNQKDGYIEIPECLRPYTGFDRID